MMVFINLMYYQLQDTVNFLSNVPDPCGKSALNFVVNIWCTRQQEFYGTYDSKVRLVGLFLCIPVRLRAREFYEAKAKLESTIIS